MLRGLIYSNIPFIKLIVAWGQSVQVPSFVLDTGFTGDLQVTPKIANELGLKPIAVEKVRIADGSVVNVPVAQAVVSMEGSNNYVNVLISNGMPLAGISLLTRFGYKATVNCKYKDVVLEKVA